MHNYRACYNSGENMIQLTNVDTQKAVLIKKDCIVVIEDVGAYRILIYVRGKEHSRILIKEEIADVFALLGA